MNREELKRNKLSSSYWDYLIGNLISNYLVDIAKDGKELHEQIDLILFYCDRGHKPPLAKIVYVESLVEKISGDLTSIVREIYSETEVKKYEETMKKIIDNLRGSILQFNKSRYTIDTVPVIIRPIISFLRVFVLSPLDDTIRLTATEQETSFAKGVLKRGGLEPEKDEDKKVKDIV